MAEFVIVVVSLFPLRVHHVSQNRSGNDPINGPMTKSKRPGKIIRSLANKPLVPVLSVLKALLAAPACDYE